MYDVNLSQRLILKIVWGYLPCQLVKNCWHFRGRLCPHPQRYDGSRRFYSIM